MSLKSIPTLGDSNWGTPLNNHLSQLLSPITGGINSFDQFVQRPTNLAADDAGKTYLYTQTGNLHQWTGTTWKVLNESVINIKDYGAVGDGVTDETSILKFIIATTLVVSSKPIKTLYFPAGTYLVSDSLVLSANIPGSYSLNIMGGDKTSTTITCDINKALLIEGGSDVNIDYRNAGFIKNITLINKSKLSSASVIDANATGRLLMENVSIFVCNYGIVGIEVISAEFNKVNISPAEGVQNLGRLKKGYSIFARNCTWRSGYILAADICCDVGGDSNSFQGMDMEFSRVCFCMPGVSTASVIGCHFETSDLLFTNVLPNSIPFSASDTIPWVNNSAQGSGIAGCVNFIACIIFFERNLTNVIVIKDSPAFIYTINITGCAFTGANSLICNSFTPGQMAQLPAGTRLNINTTQGLRFAKPPLDQYSQFTRVGSSNQDETNNLLVNQLWLGTNHAPIVGVTTTSSKKIPININGVIYYLLAE